MKIEESFGEVLGGYRRASGGLVSIQENSGDLPLQKRFMKFPGVLRGVTATLSGFRKLLGGFQGASRGCQEGVQKSFRRFLGSFGGFKRMSFMRLHENIMKVILLPLNHAELQIKRLWSPLNSLETP